MATVQWGPRPLDPKHKLAFDVLNDFFSRHPEHVVEIEVLPSAIAPPDGSLILEDDLCVGVPKKILAAAFVAACSIFFEKRANADDDSMQRALDATRVILLFDPEHLTAVNFRRSRLNTLPSGFIEGLDNATPVHLELNFLDSILTSPLHRQSKSPTLWNYRAWIIGTFNPWVCMSRRIQQDAKQITSSEDFTRELSVVLKSGERHPKNYYAWQYARRLVDRLLSSRRDLVNHQSYENSTPEEHEILCLSISTVHDWCLRNPSDTSAWSFLYCLFSHLQENKQTIPEVINQTLELAHRFHWRHEAFWVFLRTVIADSELVSKLEREKYLQEIEGKHGTNGGISSDPHATTVTTPHPSAETISWIRRNASS